MPENLRPTSILLEVIEQMERLREDLQPMKERNAELINCVKQLRRGDQGASNFADKIYTCSYTLEILVNQLRTSLENEG